MDTYLYKEEIIEHYKDPQNFGKPESFDISSKQLNPFCGDEIELFLSFSEQVVSGIYFQGHGCAISVAAASMMTEYAKGKRKEILTKFTQSDMLSLLGIEISETRKKCALLGWSVLQDCLK
jgi:nitrogen fixation NifU-like protein